MHKQKAALMRVYVFDRDLGKAAGNEELKCPKQGNYKGVPELLWKQVQHSFMPSALIMK